MLTHQHGLALITEKLQNQRLEEPAAGSFGNSPAAGSSSASSSHCSKLPSVNQDSYLISDQPVQSNALSVKGKNVWALALDPDQIPQAGWHKQGDPLLQSSRKNFLGVSERDQVLAPSSHCRHRKLRHHCQICDLSPGTPSAPPKKKHCRSLSVPPDGPSVSFFPTGKDSGESPSTRFSIGSFGYWHHSSHSHSHHHHYHHYHHHQSHNPKIWKPIAVVPLRTSTASNNNNENISPTNSHGLIKERSPVVMNYMSGDDNNNNSSSNILAFVSGNDEASPNTSRVGSSSSSSLLRFKLVPPSSFSSSASFDSGHFTTSDLQTPPGSPIPQPRPASAASDMSFNSAGWFDFSPLRNRVRILQSRSLSCEDKISGCSGCSSSPCSSSSCGATSMPCMYNSSPNTNADSSGDIGQADDSRCCGERGSNIVPRCHSQPCVLHHRRFGKKRRRDCERPTLNFNKMTETAYLTHSHCKSDLWSWSSQDAQIRSWQGQLGAGHSSVSAFSQNPFALKPIASSPLDSSELLMSKHLLPRPSSVKTSNGAEYHSKAATHSQERNGTNRNDINGDDYDEHDEEEDEEGNCSCHNNNVRDPNSVGVFPISDLDLEQIESH